VSGPRFFGPPPIVWFRYNFMSSRRRRSSSAALPTLPSDRTASKGAAAAAAGRDAIAPGVVGRRPMRSIGVGWSTTDGVQKPMSGKNSAHRISSRALFSRRLARSGLWLRRRQQRWRRTMHRMSKRNYAVSQCPRSTRHHSPESDGTLIDIL
jgi:hypothetical protein